MLTPYRLDSPGYVGWTSNISLTFTYYLINISTPILSNASGGNLTCASEITTDFAGADLSTNFSFYKNGALQQSLSTTKSCANATACSVSVPAQASSGENWLCSVKAGDWALNSTVLAIPIQPTTISAQPFQTDNGTHSFIARARATGSADISACSVSSPSCGPTYLNPTGNLNEKECSSTCSSAGTEISLFFTFIESSGGNYTTESRTFAVPNSAPAVSSISLSLTSPNATARYAAFSCSATASDPDVDPFSISYKFSAASETLRNFSSNASFSCAGVCSRGQQVVCSAVATDSFNKSSPGLSSSPATGIANTPPILSIISPPNNTIIVSTNFLEIFLSASDEDGDSLNYSATLLPSSSNFSSQTPAFNLTNLSDGNFTATFRAFDNMDYSPPAELSFSVENGNPPPTTTTIAATTTSLPSSGGGSPSQFPENNPPALPKIRPPVGAPGDGEIGLPVENPTNGTLELVYNETLLSCFPPAIPSRSNLTISCSPLPSAVGNFTATFSLKTQNGTSVGSQLQFDFFSSSSAKTKELAEISSRAQAQLERLFSLWLNCSLPEAKEHLDALQQALSSYRRKPSNSSEIGLAKLLESSEKFNASCPPPPSNSSASRIPTPAFTAPLGRPQNFFARIWQAILSFLSRLFSKAE